MEFIAEVVLELLLQLAAEFGVEIGIRALGEPFVARESRNPVLAAFGYCLIGLIIGFGSVLIFPSPLVRSERFHGINLLITPLLAGLAMSALGRIRERQGKTLLRLDSFVYGFIFALAISLVRFVVTS